MSVFHNVYLSKFEETDKREFCEQYGVSLRQTLLYMSTVMSSFKWGKVPDQPYFMPERYLLYCPRLGFFEKDGKQCIYPLYPNGSLMPDGEFDRYTAIMPDGKSIPLTRDEVVIIFSNSLKVPTYVLVQDFAKHTSYALNSIDTMLRRAMLPPLIGAESEEQLKLISEIEEPERLLKTVLALPNYTGYNKDKLERVPVFDNREADVLALWDVFSRYDRMFYRTFGISTVGIQKNERLTEAESTGEEEMTRYTIFQDMYNNRIDGIQRVKDKFGYELTLEVMRDQKTVYELSQSNDEKIRMRKIEATKGANISQEGGEENDSSEKGAD